MTLVRSADVDTALPERRGRMSSPPRVLFVVPTISRSAGGPTFTLAEYLSALGAKGVAAVVATTRPSPDDLRWFRERAPAATIRTFGGFGRGAFLTSPGVVAWAAAHAREFDAVHVFGTLNPISSFAARACALRGAPTVVCALGTASDYTFEHRRSLLKHLWWSVLDRPTLRRVLLHVESPAERREAVRRNPELAGRTHVVPPPFRASEVGPGDRREGQVLFLSRLHPVKNVEALLAAWPAVLAAHPRATLVVAGGGEGGYEARLRALARTSDPRGSSIRFTGFVHGERKRELLATSSVFVLPSQHENFGMAAVEAAAAGLPCVLSANVDVGDILEAEGVVVRCDLTPPSIARAVVSVLSDEDFRERCRTRGPAAVARHLAPAVVADSLCALYAAAGSKAFAAGACGAGHAPSVA